jgi:AraC-like DNA-binding protein
MAGMTSRAARFVAARLEHVLLPPHEADGYTSDSEPFAIGVAFTGQTDAVVAHADGPARSLDFEPGTAGVNGARPLTWLRTRVPSESVEIVPGAAALRRAADEHGISWDRLDGYRQQPRDPAIWAAAVTVRRALATGCATEEWAEELVTPLLAHVATSYAGGRPTDGVVRDRTLVRRVTDRIHGAPFAAHPLHELAAEVHLSPFHFLRLFVRTAGITPHRYVVAVRGEHLRGLLAVDGASVPSVAAEVGVEARQLRRLHHRAVGRSPRGGL